MRATLRGIAVDVVHAHSPPPLASQYAGSIAMERGIPYVVTYHCDVDVPSALGTLIESIYRRSLGATTLRNADQVVVTTQTYGATSRAVWRYNPAVIPNAVDHRRFRPDIDAGWVRERLKILASVPIVLLVGPERGRAMGQRGREKVLASFDIERVTDQIETLYQTILNRRRAPTPRP